MLFRKKMPRACGYCAWGTKMDHDGILCPKKGLCSASDSCRKYTYDPCKRQPPRAKALDFKKYQDEDFTL